MDEALEFLAFEPKELNAEDSTVIALSYMKALVKSTNKVMEYNWDDGFSFERW